MLHTGENLTSYTYIQFLCPSHAHFFLTVSISVFLSLSHKLKHTLTSVTPCSLQSPGAISQSVNGVWETPTSLLLSSLHNAQPPSPPGVASNTPPECVCVFAHTCNPVLVESWSGEESHTTKLGTAWAHVLFVQKHDGISLTSTFH